MPNELNIQNAFRQLLFISIIVIAGLAVGYMAKRSAHSLGIYDLKLDYRQIHKKYKSQVVVYGTSTCEYCQKTRAYFKEKKIAFVDLDIQNSPSAKADAASYKITSVPVVVIGNAQIIGFDTNSFERALAKIN
jgi:glutaredoxin